MTCPGFQSSLHSPTSSSCGGGVIRSFLCLPWMGRQCIPPQELTEIPPNPAFSSWTAPLPISVTTAFLSPFCRYHITMTTENHPTCLVISPSLGSVTKSNSAGQANLVPTHTAG